MVVPFHLDVLGGARGQTLFKTTLVTPSTIIQSSSQLTPNNTRGELDSVSIGKEGRWVGLDLSDLEASTGIRDAISSLHAREERTGQATAGLSEGTSTGRVREGNARRSRASTNSLVNVRRSTGRR